jgi:hypothetical protein
MKKINFKIIEICVKILTFICLIVWNLVNNSTIPLTVFALIVYTFYLEYKMILLQSIIRDNVKKIDDDISKLYINQKDIITLFNSFKNIMKKIESKK